MAGVKNSKSEAGGSVAQLPEGVLSDFLPYLLSITSNAVSSRIAQEYSERFGLKIAEWRVMAVLGDSGTLTQRELTAITLMDKVAVNRACKALEERGLAEREPNANDGRSHHLRLTQTGEDVFQRIMPLALGMEAQIEAILSPDEAAQLRSVLKRLHAHVGEINPDAPAPGM